MSFNLRTRIVYLTRSGEQVASDSLSRSRMSLRSHAFSFLLLTYTKSVGFFVICPHFIVSRQHQASCLYMFNRNKEEGETPAVLLSPCLFHQKSDLQQISSNVLMMSNGSYSHSSYISARKWLFGDPLMFDQASLICPVDYCRSYVSLFGLNVLINL